MTSFVSASSAVHVQVSPAPSGRRLRQRDVLRLRVGERPRLVDLDAAGPDVPDRLVMELGAGPAGVDRSFVTVLIETPVKREIVRSDEPSTSIWRMVARRAVLSLFMS